MGYGAYAITRNDGQTIQAGYLINTVCEETDCTEQIDRGLAHLCGATPGGDEYGCGGYYCGRHLYGGVGPAEGLCARCNKRHDTGEDPTNDEAAMQILSDQGAQCGSCGDEPGNRNCPDCETCRARYVKALREAGWAPRSETMHEATRLLENEDHLAAAADLREMTAQA